MAINSIFSICFYFFQKIPQVNLCYVCFFKLSHSLKHNEIKKKVSHNTNSTLSFFHHHCQRSKIVPSQLFASSCCNRKHAVNFSHCSKTALGTLHLLVPSFGSSAIRRRKSARWTPACLCDYGASALIVARNVNAQFDQFFHYLSLLSTLVVWCEITLYFPEITLRLWVGSHRLEAQVESDLCFTVHLKENIPKYLKYCKEINTTKHLTSTAFCLSAGCLEIVQ